MAKADIFVDVGANLGLFSCLGALVGNYVIAIEPHPLNLKLLYRNFSLNRLDDRFEVHAAALSHRQQIASLFGGQQGGSLLEKWAGNESNYDTTVYVNTLDHLLRDRFFGRRILVKLDVEGNEHAVLQGSIDSLGRCPAPVWVVEVGLTENFAKSVNPHYLDIFEVFWSSGYIAKPLTQPARVLTRSEVNRWLNDLHTDHDDINYIFTKN